MEYGLSLWSALLGNPSGPGHILPYFPPFVLIWIQTTNLYRNHISIFSVLEIADGKILSEYHNVFSSFLAEIGQTTTISSYVEFFKVFF